MSVNILIGVDDSHESRDAVKTAFDLFGPDVEYTIVSVGSARQPFAAAYAGGFATSGYELNQRFEEAAVAEARRRADEAVGDLPGGADVDVELGHVGTTLCELASEHRADAIVIGSHDKNAWQRLFDPSVGRFLIDHAPCPVVVVRG